MSYKIVLTIQAEHQHRSLSIDEAIRISEALTEAVQDKRTKGGTHQVNEVVAVEVRGDPE